MKEIKVFSLETRLGPFFGAVGPRGLVALTIPRKGKEQFLARLARVAPGARLVEVPARELPAGRWLERYLSGRRPGRLPAWELLGVSPFTRQVLKEVAAIPYGETLSYGQIAARVGRPKAARAVGRAVGSNPLPVVIPCHRVLGADGSLTGFGSGLATKRALLELEAQGAPLLS